MNQKKILAFFMSLLLLVTTAPFPLRIPSLSVQADGDIKGADNIVARADYLYNITWTCEKDVLGWKNAYLYEAGETYHIPYGQPVSEGKYIYWGISISDFLLSTTDPESIFYTQRGGSASQPSTYFAMDCSAFVSYCWGLPKRYTTASWSSLDVTCLGRCAGENIQDLEPGDALNVAKYHIVLVTDVIYDDAGRVSQVEITEQTIPQARRSLYTINQLDQIYNEYTIYRYNQRDSVPVPGDDACRCTTKKAGVYGSDTLTEDIPIYEAHNIESKVLGYIPAGTRIRVTKTNDFWGHVTYNGINGCILMTNLYLISQAVVYDPIGSFDVVKGVEGGVLVCGWALDEDDVAQALEYHVYIGGDAASQAPSYKRYANKLRADLEESIPGMGEYHGILDVIHTSVTGELPVYIYGINIGSGSNVLLGTFSVTIEPDLVDPAMGSLSASEISPDGFTVSGRASDNAALHHYLIRVSTKDDPDTVYEKKIYCREMEELEYDVVINREMFQGETPEVIVSVEMFDSAGNSVQDEIIVQIPKADYQISFDPGYPDLVIENQIKHFGEDLRLSDTIPESRYGVFLAWNTQADGQGQEYLPGSSFELDEDTRLYAIWKPHCPFLDVTPGSWQYDVALYAYQNKIIYGTSATSFSPNAQMTRAQFVTILWRMEGSENVEYQNAFADVSSDMYCAKALQWAKNNCLAYGMDDGRFRPNDSMTREEFMAFLYRYARFKGYSVEVDNSQKYYECSDADQVSNFAKQVVAWGYERGLIAADGLLRPRQSITRIQAMAIIKRFIEYYKN